MLQKQAGIGSAYKAIKGSTSKFLNTIMEPDELKFVAAMHALPVPFTGYLSYPIMAKRGAQYVRYRVQKHLANRAGTVPPLPLAYARPYNDARASRKAFEAARMLADKAPKNPSKGIIRMEDLANTPAKSPNIAFKYAAISLSQIPRRAVESGAGRALLRHGSDAGLGAAAGYAVDSPDKPIGMGIGALGGLVGGPAARYLARRAGSVRKSLDYLASKDPVKHAKTLSTLRLMKSGADVPAKEVRQALSAIAPGAALAAGGSAVGAAIGGGVVQGGHQEYQQYKNRRYITGGYTGMAKLSSGLRILEKRARAAHWRELPAGQTGTDKSGGKVQGRTWVNGIVEYGKDVKTMAPGFAIKQLTDFPKGTVEDLIERKILGSQAPPLKQSQTALGQAALRGGKRYLGGLAGGLVTGPLFISGMKQAASDDANERKKGYAKVLGSSSAYAGVKGAMEFAKAEAGGGRKALAGGTARLLINAPAVLGTVAGIAAGKSKDGEQPSTKRLLIGGALGGAAGGLIKGMSEVPIQEVIEKGKVAPGALRRMVARGGGRATGGALGGMALATLFRHLSKDKTKKEKTDAA